MEEEFAIGRSKMLYAFIGTVLLLCSILISLFVIRDWHSVSNRNDYSVILLMICPSVSYCIYSWYIVFTNKKILVINRQGVLYKRKFIDWDNIKSFKTETIPGEDVDYDRLIIFLFSSNEQLIISLADLDIKSGELKEVLFKFSTNSYIIDNGHSTSK